MRAANGIITILDLIESQVPPKDARVSRAGEYQGKTNADPRDTPFQREQDAWQKSYWEAVGVAIANRVEELKLANRKLNALTLNHYISLGEAACAEHVKQRAARRLALGLNRQDLDPKHPDDLMSIYEA